MGINLSNAVLAARTSQGAFTGVGPDLAAVISHACGRRLVLVPTASPAELMRTLERGGCDLGLIARDPAREVWLRFSSPYASLDATFAVRTRSPWKGFTDLDSARSRIAVSRDTPYAAWLRRHTSSLRLVGAADHASARHLFEAGATDALAGLRAQLERDRFDGPVRVLPGRFMSVDHCVAVRRANGQRLDEAAAVLDALGAGGALRELLARHGRAELLPDWAMLEL